jgi:hypothetical protein
MVDHNHHMVDVLPNSVISNLLSIVNLLLKLLIHHIMTTFTIRTTIVHWDGCENNISSQNILGDQDDKRL